MLVVGFGTQITLSSYSQVSRNGRRQGVRNWATYCASSSVCGGFVGRLICPLRTEARRTSGGIVPFLIEGKTFAWQLPPEESDSWKVSLLSPLGEVKRSFWGVELAQPIQERPALEVFFIRLTGSSSPGRLTLLVLSICDWRRATK